MRQNRWPIANRSGGIENQRPAPVGIHTGTRRKGIGSVLGMAKQWQILRYIYCIRSFLAQARLEHFAFAAWPPPATSTRVPKGLLDKREEKRHNDAYANVQ
jgi:hypothetical protein